MTVLRGVDGCPAGWLCVSLEIESGKVLTDVYPNAEDLFEQDSSAVTAIDIPIGLPTTQPRACDLQARRLLGPRASSVFPAPVRAAFEADSYPAACSPSQELCGKRLSKQSYAILPKIREVDAILRSSPSLLDRVYEVHPEVCFYFWNGRRPMGHSKKSGFGFSDRLRLVEEEFGPVAERMRTAVPRKTASDDDILDALGAVWTARRIHAGSAARVTEMEERDERGLPMQIHA